MTACVEFSLAQANADQVNLSYYRWSSNFHQKSLESFTLSKVDLKEIYRTNQLTVKQLPIQERK